MMAALILLVYITLYVMRLLPNVSLAGLYYRENYTCTRHAYRSWWISSAVCYVELVLYILFHCLVQYNFLLQTLNLIYLISFVDSRVTDESDDAAGMKLPWQTNILFIMTSSTSDCRPRLGAEVGAARGRKSPIPICKSWIRHRWLDQYLDSRRRIGADIYPTRPR